VIRFDNFLKVVKSKCKLILDISLKLFYTDNQGVNWAIAVMRNDRGKSGLHRTECQITSGRREPTESATENIPPTLII